MADIRELRFDVYICLCNALTDRRLRQVTAETGATRPSEVYAACGCRAQCGQCVRSVVDMLREIGGATAGGVPSAAV